MELSTAISLIKNGVDQSPDQTWADLGAGPGLFTKALAQVVGERTTVYAIDKSKEVRNIASDNSVLIKPVVIDFENEFDLPKCDGILMANSLHFVRDQSKFIERLRGMLNKNGRLIIVEYELGQANAWVPYPIKFEKLKLLAKKSGAAHSAKLIEVPSSYHRAIYSALVKFD